MKKNSWHLRCLQILVVDVPLAEKTRCLAAHIFSFSNFICITVGAVVRCSLIQSHRCKQYTMTLNAIVDYAMAINLVQEVVSKNSIYFNRGKQTQKHVNMKNCGNISKKKIRLLYQG